MFSIATLRKYKTGDYSFEDGVLHSLPIELRDKPRIEAYSKINAPGWGYSEYGYSYFAFSVPKGELIVLPGLIISDSQRSYKKFYGYNVCFSRLQIEKFAAGIKGVLDGVEKQSIQDQSILVHDLRVLSNAIYNAAEEAKKLVSYNAGVSEGLKRIENILASQGMLRLRIDALDFSGDTINVGTDYNIAIFRKVDKVVRCFKSRAYIEHKTIDLTGKSFRMTVGPSILELIVYGLIDNGLKYSPANGRIDVEVKDVGNNTLISISSLGPFIDESEKNGIFSRGVRGKAALATTVPGTGIGLHMVHKITTEMFGGTISVEQKPDKYMLGDGGTYFQTTFNVVLPSFESIV